MTHSDSPSTATSTSALRPSERKGGKAAVRHGNVLWVDADTAESQERAFAMAIPPTVVIASGSPGHAHLYWPLRRPIGPDELMRANQRLASHLGADLQATDAARVLRVAGTLNWKHNPPATVECVRLEIRGRQPSAAEVLGDVPELPPQQRPSPVRALRAEVGTREDPLRSIAASEYVPALIGRPLSHGKIQCPFHGQGGERTPSLHAYGDEGWYCFACNEGGSIIDLGAKLYGIEPRGSGFHEIRRRLAADLLGSEAAA